MIAPRPKKHTQVPLKDDAPLLEALRKLAVPNAPTYGQWISTGPQNAALEAVVSEIGQVVLPRRIHVCLRDSAASFDLIVSNRHLIAIDGVPSVTSDLNAQDVVQELLSASIGASAVKFDVIERSPTLPEAARSWPFDALWACVQELQAPMQLSDGLASLIPSLTPLCLAWVQCQDTGQVFSHGGADPDGWLRKFCEHRLSIGATEQPFPKPQDALALLPVNDRQMLLELRMEDMRVFGLCATDVRGRVLALWRDFLTQKAGA